MVEMLDDFRVDSTLGSLTLVAGSNLHPRARAYLEARIAQLNGYKRAGLWHGYQAFSLYDPPPESEPGKRAWVHRLERVFQRARKPASVTMALSYACQCQCVHCSVTPSDKLVLSTADWELQIDDALDLGATTIVFTGGEPLLYPELVELVRYVDKRYATVIMFTNGELLTRTLCLQLADAGLYGAFVSIDSAVAHTHDNIRGRRGLFNQALSGIKNLQACGLIAGLSFCCSHSRLGEFDQLLDLARDIGVNEVSEFDALPAGRWKETDDLLTEDDHKLIQQKTAEYRKDPTYPTLLAASVVKSKLSVGCFAGLTMCHITAHGDVRPCDFTPVDFGNVREQLLSEIWKGMVNHPLWKRRRFTCRMQSAEFRSKAGVLQ